MRAGARALAAAFTLAAALALFAGPAAAQGESQQSAQAQEIADQELEQFARAYIEIAEVRQEMQSELAQASQEERGQIRQEANQQMAQILQEQDLTIQRYRQITTTLNADSAQRAEFQTVVEEIRAEDDGGGV